MVKKFNHDFALSNFLFRSVKPANNADSDKYKSTGYGLGFDYRSEFPFTDGSMEKMSFFLSWADINWSMNIDHKDKEILIIDEASAQRLDDTTLTADARYLIYFTQPNKRFVLSAHCHGSTSFLFVNATKIHQFKDSKTKDYTLC